MMKFSFGAMGVAALLTLSSAAMAGTTNVDDGIAIKGYDPVAYFTDNKPVEGNAAYKFEYAGATYEFATEAHRALFAAMPEKYVPQFGGFCAYGAAYGVKADIDPAAFSIVDGKLYLNRTLNVREKWKQDITGNIHKAEDAWPTVSQRTDVVR